MTLEFDDIDAVMYDVEIAPLDAIGVEIARRHLLNPETAWYGRRRLSALTASTEFEKLHPRGHDGKFIRKFGFVRWLLDGKWVRGQVTDIGDDGKITIKRDGFGGKANIVLPSNVLYSVPTPKAHLELPNPKTGKEVEGFTKIGGQTGYHSGGLYEVTLPDVGGPEGTLIPGDKYYVKTAASPTHAREEILANRLYELAGVPVPDVSMGVGITTVASKILQKDADLGDVVDKDPELKRMVQENLPVDAWLANWDVIGGNTADNVIIVGGVPFRVDAGGALDFKGIGAAKPSGAFGNTVGEIETMRDMNMNPQAAYVFHGASMDTMRPGAKRVAAISSQEIQDAVADAGLEKSLGDKLIARRKDLMTRFGVPEPDFTSDASKVMPVETQLLISGEEKPDTSKLVYHSASQSWIAAEPRPFEKVRDEYLSNLSTWPGLKVVKGTDLDVTSPDRPLVARSGQAFQVTKLNDDVFTLSDLATGEEHVEFKTADQDFVTLPRDDLREQNYVALARGLVDARINEFMTSHDDPVDVFENTDPLDSSLPDHARVKVATLLGPSVKRSNLKPGSYFWTSDGGVRRVTNAPHDDNYVYAEDVSGSSKAFDVSTGAPFEIAVGTFAPQLLDAYFSRAELDQHVAEMDEPEVVPSVKPWPDLQALLNEEDVNTPEEQAIQDLGGLGAIPVTAPPKVEQYPPVDGVSSSLPIAAKQVDLAKAIKTSDDLEKTNLIGKTFVFTNAIPLKDDKKLVGQTQAYQGLFQVIEATAFPDTYKGGFNVKIKGVSQNGTVRQWNFNTKDGPYYGGGELKLTQVDVAMTPQPPATLKKDQSVVLGGTVVGAWQKSWGYNQWTATIDAAHSVYGVDTIVSTYNQKDLKKNVGEHVVPAEVLQPKVIVKPSAAVSLEVSVKDAGKSAGTLVGGGDATVGTWVMSTKDGLVGKITGFPNLDKYPNDVWITTPDGVKKSRKITMLKAVPDPTAPTYVIPFNDTKLADGTPVGLGMRLKVGTSGKEVEGVVLKSNADGYVQILDDATGKKVWRKASTGVQLEKSPADEAGVPEMKTGMKVSKPGPKAGHVLYPAANGAVIPMSPARDAWVEAGRGLTKDGYVPSVGLRVRDGKASGSKALVITKIKSSYDASPNSVQVWDAEKGKFSYRSITGLWVDHAAELQNTSDTPVARISTLLNGSGKEATLPDGTVVYRAKIKKYVKARSGSGYENRVVDTYFYAKPKSSITGGQSQLFFINDNADGSLAFVKSDAKYSMPQMQETFERVAIIDSSSKLHGQTVTSKGTKDQSFVAYDPALSSLELTLHAKELKELEAASATDSVPAAKTVPADVIKPLPRPPAKEITSYPDFPKVTGVGVDLDATSIKGSTSIIGSVKAALEARGKVKSGSAIHYGVGDSDHIEDMTVRSQIVVDETGAESVELRFHLLEDKVDALSQQLMISEGSTKGAWVQELVKPTALVSGDAIAVRKSSSAGILKPATSMSVPNARVTGSPKLIGKGKSGSDLYRVPVTFNDGSLGEVDLEKRVADSVPLFTFDYDKVNPGTGTYILNPDAEKAGWSIGDQGMGYAYGEPSVNLGSGSWGIYIDEKGRKNIANTKYHKITSDGWRLRRDLSDDAEFEDLGGYVDVNVAPVKPDGRVNVGYGNPQRATINGDVTIRVPIPDEDSLTADLVSSTVSRLLESVGIPPEKQGAPSKEQLATLALNKVYKQYAVGYKHQQVPDVQPNDSASVQKVLDQIDNALSDDVLSSPLGRKATINDIRLHVWDNGRVTVEVSDEVADAAAKRQNASSFGHSLHGNAMDNVLTGAGNGVMSSDERFAAGVVTTGMSPGDDNYNDAANRVFLSARNGKTGSNNILFSPRVINKSTDFYWHPGDKFGKRTSGNRQWLSASAGGSNELMYKRRLELSQIGFAVVSTQTEKDQLLAKLHKQGIDFFGKRPINDVIVVSGNYQIPTDWTAGASEEGVEIPLGDFLAGLSTPVLTPGVPVGTP